MNLKSKTALAALALIASTAALAQATAPEPDYTLAYNIGAVTQYRFRGMEQTSGKPAIQGGIDFAHKSGFYAGAWASNVNWIKDFNGATQGDYEVDLYGGYKAEIMPGLGYDVGLMTYNYPGNNSGDAGTPGAGSWTRADTKEVYLGLTYNIVSAKYSQTLGNFMGFPSSNGSRYYEVAATFDLGHGLTLTPHVGYQYIPNQNNGLGQIVTDGSAANYTDVALTLGKDFGNGWSASLAAISTNANTAGFWTATASAGNNNTGVNRFFGGSVAVAGVKYSF